MTLENIFDSIFETFSKLGRLGFNTKAHRANGTENAVLVSGMHFFSVSLLLWFETIKPWKIFYDEYDENKDTPFLLLQQFIKFFTLFNIITLVFAAVYNTIVKVNESLFDS